MLSACVVLALAAGASKPLLLWAKPGGSDFRDLSGAPYHGEFAKKLKHLDGHTGLALLQPGWQLIACFALPGNNEPSVVSGRPDHPRRCPITTLWWAPPVRSSHSGFVQRAGKQLWVSELQPPGQVATIDVGAATGRWRTVGKWRPGKKTPGSEFVLNFETHPLDRRTNDPTKPSTVSAFDSDSISVTVNTPKRYRSLATRVEAFDRKGRKLMPAGSMVVGIGTRYFFQLIDEADLHPAKLAGVRLEVRPYKWSTVRLTRSPASFSAISLY